MCQALKAVSNKKLDACICQPPIANCHFFFEFSDRELVCFRFKRAVLCDFPSRFAASKSMWPDFFSLAKPQRVQPRSQSLDRIISMRDKCVCICPNSRLWCRRRERLMTFEEKWNLMGMPTHRHEAVLQELSPALPHHLVGNGWCFYNVVPALLVALAVAQGPVNWLT